MPLAEEVKARTQNKILPFVGGHFWEPRGLVGRAAPTQACANREFSLHANREFSRERCTFQGFRTLQPCYLAKNICLFWVCGCRLSPRSTLVPPVSEAWTHTAPQQHGEASAGHLGASLAGPGSFKDTNVEFQESGQSLGVCWVLGSHWWALPPLRAGAQGQVGKRRGWHFSERVSGRLLTSRPEVPREMGPEEGLMQPPGRVTEASSMWRTGGRGSG